MKKLFFALALTGIIGAATVDTASAVTHSKVFVKGGEDDKIKKKDCKKDSKCCSKDANASSADKKSCSKGSGCCHSKAGATAGSTSETKSDAKPVEGQK